MAHSQSITQPLTAYLIDKGIIIIHKRVRTFSRANSLLSLFAFLLENSQRFASKLETMSRPEFAKRPAPQQPEAVGRRGAWKTVKKPSLRFSQKYLDEAVGV